MSTHTAYYFITIAQTGNLNQAAQLLYVSQSSLSKYIKRLEKSLGVPLFDHGVTPLQLNEAGKLYLHYLLDAREREKDMSMQIQEFIHQERGTFYLGIPPFCGEYFLPQILPHFIKRYPNVHLKLAEGTGESLESRLDNQEIDLAILHSPISSPSLHVQELLKEQIFLIAHQNSTPNLNILPVVSVGLN